MVRFTGKSNQRGFTLVELLIVIAIIGVLSTIGIPAFKRMIQKSKKVEAKTSLGGLYTAEQGFFSEYGAYGNNLASIGFNVDANIAAGEMYYSSGFPNATCTAGITAIAPGSADQAGLPIEGAFPAYYTAFVLGPANSPYAKSQFFVWNGISTYCAATSGATAYTLTDGAPVNAATAIGILSYTPGGAAVTAYVAGSPANGYIATATGVISSNTVRAGAAATADVWTIDHQRTLRNTVDGVN